MALKAAIEGARPVKLKIFFFGLIAVASLDLHANHGCLSVFSEFEDTFKQTIGKIDYISATPKGRSQSGFLEFHLNSQSKYELLKDQHYKNFIDDTVEIIYQDIQPFGHIAMRIGDRYYSFNNVRYTSARGFSPADLREGNLGFVFQSDKKVINDMRAEIEAFYENSAKYNVPPFDPYAPPLEIVKKRGSYRYKSNSPKYPNNEAIGEKVDLVDNGSDAYLQTPDGFKYTVIKRDGKYFTPSYSCSSSASCVMSRYLGIDMSPDMGKGGAKYLKKMIEQEGEAGFTDLKALIRY